MPLLNVLQFCAKYWPELHWTQGKHTRSDVWLQSAEM
jgi:hypothetical protein